MRVVLDIFGPPIAKHRPRFASRGKHPRTYSDQRREEEAWKLMALTQLTGQKGLPIPKPVPVVLQCVFYMPIPRSLSKRKTLGLMDTPHTKRPDTDNLVKFVKDCLNGLAWHDDSQVWIVEARKIYGQEPRSVVMVEWNPDAQKFNAKASKFIQQDVIPGKNKVAMSAAEKIALARK